jgi:nucleoside-diphosphate-sugar epimerase
VPPRPRAHRIHLDDAAAATAAALVRGSSGIYNVVDDDPARVSEWLPYLADTVGAKRPMRIPKWLAGIAAGAVPVQWMTEARGASRTRRQSASSAGNRAGGAGARASARR